MNIAKRMPKLQNIALTSKLSVLSNEKNVRNVNLYHLKTFHKQRDIFYARFNVRNIFFAD